MYEELIQRLAKFGLEVEKDKTHILPFGRYKGTKETFDIVKLNAEIKEIVAREQMLRDEIDRIIAEIEME